MLYKHILGQVDLPNVFEISISDAIEIDFSSLENIDNIIYNKIEVDTQGTFIISKKSLSIIYTPIPYYASDEIVIRFFDINDDIQIFNIPVIVRDSIVRSNNTPPKDNNPDQGETDNTLPLPDINENETDDNGLNENETDDNGTDTSPNGPLDPAEEWNAKHNISPDKCEYVGPINNKSNELNRIILSLKPKITDAEPFWAKEIYEYKLAIFNKTYSMMSMVWTLVNLSLNVIKIENVDGDLQVWLRKDFLLSIEKLKPKLLK